MKNVWKSGAVALALMMAGSAHAAFIGQSTGTITNGTLLYQGLGPLTLGSGIGTGRWTQGLCGVVSGNTVCTMSGTYIDTAGGDGTPGGGGSFIFTESFTGTGLTPAIARSSTPGNDDLFFTSVGSALFTLTLTPLGGGSITSVFPANSNALNFSLFYLAGTTSCTGLAVGQSCGSGQVGLTPGATVTGQVRLSFNIPSAVVVAAVPEPATWGLMILGFGLTGAAMRRRRNGTVVLA